MIMRRFIKTLITPKTVVLFKHKAHQIKADSVTEKIEQHTHLGLKIKIYFSLQFLDQKLLSIYFLHIFQILYIFKKIIF